VGGSGIGGGSGSGSGRVNIRKRYVVYVGVTYIVWVFMRLLAVYVHVYDNIDALRSVYS
jgi:hypothetical protein